MIETGGASSKQRQEELLDQAGEYLAGGGLGIFVLPRDVNLVVARAKGSHLWDVSGREFIDYHLGSGPALLGHAHPAVVEAVSAQLSKGSTYYFLNEHAIKLAKRMVEASPCAEVVHFTGSGTESTFFSLRVARAHTGRTKIMKFEGGWHGMHDYALWGTVPAVPSDYPHSNPDSAGIPAEIASTVLVAPFNETERAVKMIEENASDLAAVIVEPLQRVLLPEPGFLEALREVTRKHGIVLIFDEVVTGFRIAWGGAQERYGVVPDIAAYGKAMTGGFPMAALVGRRDVMAPLDARKIERHQHAWASGTLNGNPISAAAGNAALDILSQPGSYDHFHRIGGRLRKGFKELGAKYGFAVQCPGEDVVFGVRFMANENPRTWVDLIPADKKLGLEWAVGMLRRGILVNPNEKFYISVAHSDADVDRTLEAAEESFKAMKR